MSNIQIIMGTSKTITAKGYTGPLDANGNTTGNQVPGATMSYACSDPALTVTAAGQATPVSVKAAIAVTVTSSNPSSVGIIYVDVIAAPNGQTTGPAQIQSFSATVS